jgi:hypothetical protein
MKKFLFTILTSLCLISTFAYANPQIDKAYQEKQSDVQVQGVGKVIKVLSDDNKGSQTSKILTKITIKFDTISSSQY